MDPASLYWATLDCLKLKGVMFIELSYSNALVAVAFAVDAFRETASLMIWLLSASLGGMFFTCTSNEGVIWEFWLF